MKAIQQQLKYEEELIHLLQKEIFTNCYYAGIDLTEHFWLGAFLSDMLFIFNNYWKLNCIHRTFKRK